MKGAIIKMKSTRYEGPFDTRASEWIGDMTVWIRENSGDNSEQRARLIRNLRRAIEEDLTPRQRQMIKLYYFEKKNIPQIARELGINKGAVSRTIGRGRNRIRRLLEYSF